MTKLFASITSPYIRLFGALFLLIILLLKGTDFTTPAGWASLRPNLLAEAIGIFVAIFCVDFYLRSRERSAWGKVERLVRERLLSAMFKSTGMLELTLCIQTRENWIGKCVQNKLPMVDYHLGVSCSQLILRSAELGKKDSSFNYGLVQKSADEMVDMVESVFSKHSRHFEPTEVEELMRLQQTLISFSGDLSFGESVSRGDQELAASARPMVAYSARKFLEQLDRAERECARVYANRLKVQWIAPPAPVPSI